MCTASDSASMSSNLKIIIIFERGTIASRTTNDALALRKTYFFCELVRNPCIFIMKLWKQNTIKEKIENSLKKEEEEKKKKIKVYSTRYSQAVTHPSTNRARRCLISVIGREPVFST